MIARLLRTIALVLSYFVSCKHINIVKKFKFHLKVFFMKLNLPNDCTVNKKYTTFHSFNIFYTNIQIKTTIIAVFVKSNYTFNNPQGHRNLSLVI